MVTLLLKLGADPHAKAQYGSTPLDFAVERKHDDVVAILKKATAEVKLKPVPSPREPAASSSTPISPRLRHVDSPAKESPVHTPSPSRGPLSQEEVRHAYIHPLHTQYSYSQYTTYSI